MDFRFTSTQETWRQEVRAWVKANAPKLRDTRADAWAVSKEVREEQRRYCRRLAEKGWLTLHWPKEYGGQGRSYMDQLIFREEGGWNHVGRATQGLMNTGPTLMVHGTEEQKRRFLPPIARGDVIWCQGFSEPGAGSDLASLQCRATEDGDDFVINGQKIWTSGAQIADWCYILVRTDPDAPKHRGISMLLVDMKTPGITIQPIQTLEGAAHFNQVFWDNTRVPKSNLVGEKNRGWYVGTTALDFERSGIGYAQGARESLRKMSRYALRTGIARRQPWVGHALANAAVEIEVARVLSYRVVWMQEQGKIPNAEASIVKLYGTELGQRIAQLGMRIGSLHGQLEWDSLRAVDGGSFPHRYLNSVSATIAAGTSEIQRNIIAQRGLGLPRA